MANQQLVDYIGQQREKGIGDEAIRAALLGVGWQKNDVEEALAPGAPAALSAEVSHGASAQPASPGLASTDTLSASAAPAATAEALTIPDPVSGSAFAGSSDKPSDTNPAPVISESVLAGGMTVSSGKSGGRRTPVIALAVLCILFLAAAVYFFVQNRTLSAKVAALQASNTALTSQMAAITRNQEQANANFSQLTGEINDLSSQLSLFALPVSTSTAPQPVSLSGVLGGGGKNSYTLLTSKNVLITIANSRDPKVAAALQNLVATQVQVMGTHAAGSRDITLTAVNGAPISAPSPPTQTSSTPVAP